MMQVEKDTVVSISYQLTDVDGNILEKSDDPVSYLHGGYDGIFPVVEEALQGKNEGDACVVRLEPDDAFGEYDAELVRVEPRSMFPAQDISVGMQFEGGAENGEQLIYTVTELTDDKVVVDGNHPLAGQALNFECTVRSVRPATKQELEHSHVHGPDGHHHH